MNITVLLKSQKVIKFLRDICINLLKCKQVSLCYQSISATIVSNLLESLAKLKIRLLFTYIYGRGLGEHAYTSVEF